jgi:hypothetical protein
MFVFVFYPFFFLSLFFFLGGVYLSVIFFLQDMYNLNSIIFFLSLLLSILLLLFVPFSIFVFQTLARYSVQKKTYTNSIVGLNLFFCYCYLSNRIFLWFEEKENNKERYMRISCFEWTF